MCRDACSVPLAHTFWVCRVSLLINRLRCASLSRLAILTNMARRRQRQFISAKFFPTKPHAAHFRYPLPCGHYPCKRTLFMWITAVSLADTKPHGAAAVLLRQCYTAAHANVRVANRPYISLGIRSGRRQPSIETPFRNSIETAADTSSRSPTTATMGRYSPAAGPHFGRTRC